MPTIRPKYEPSKYRYVVKELVNGREQWRMQIRGHSAKRYKSERQAAIAADVILIKKGKPPVNILKPLK